MSIAAIKNIWQFPEQRPDLDFVNHGWFPAENERVLASHLNASTKLVVELGSWLGLSTRAMTDMAPNANILAVDHWLGSSENFIDPVWAEARFLLYDQFIANCWEYRDRLVPCRADTITALHVFYHFGLKPDLIYVDAGHEYTAVFCDLLTAVTLFPEAQFVGDDWAWESVQKAVREIQTHTQFDLKTDGTCWWFARKGV